MTINENDLIAGLPPGDIEYVQGLINSHGCWDVAIFAPGTTERVATIASGMDKSVACWLVIKLRAVRPLAEAHALARKLGDVLSGNDDPS
jgi:hypothetical protein